MNSTGRILLLLSGGLDSMVNLAEAAAGERDITALFIDYGHIAAIREEEATREQIAQYGAELRKIELPWYRALLPPALRGDSTVSTDGEQTHNDDEAVWAPNRNSLLVAIAAAFAEANGIGEIIAGFNAEEAITFPDNSQEFIDAYNEILKLSTKNEITLSSYTIATDKKAIVKRAMELGAPLNTVYSCYTAGPKMCGRCNSCLRLTAAFSANDIMSDFSGLFIGQLTF